MSRDTANAISSWEIAKSERARTWWIGLLCSRTDNLPSPAPPKTNSWKVVEQLQTTIQTTYQFRPTNKWTDTFAGLQFFRSKTNYPQERSTQTCVEQTHPQSKNAQDQHLRDTEGANREFNNPNSSSVIGLYRWTRWWDLLLLSYPFPPEKRAKVTEIRGYWDRKIPWSPRAWIYLYLYDCPHEYQSKSRRRSFHVRFMAFLMIFLSNSPHIIRQSSFGDSSFLSPYVDWVSIAYSLHKLAISSYH